MSVRFRFGDFKAAEAILCLRVLSASGQKVEVGCSNTKVLFPSKSRCRGSCLWV
jgi:hypothetical protein